jgi:hypothetical protein
MANPAISQGTLLLPLQYWKKSLIHLLSFLQISLQVMEIANAQSVTL